MNTPTPPPPKAAEENQQAAEPSRAIINSSAEVGELFAAIAKAQGDFKTVRKDAENPFFKSAYATLAAVVEMLRKPLAESGIGYIQSITDGGGRLRMNTLITHKSGQFIISSIPFALASTAKPQDIGSAITYAKRYGLQAAFGVVVAEDPTDDDGNAASGNPSPVAPNRKN